MSKYIQITSPTGIAKWPKLNEADYKYKTVEGEFSVSLIYTPEEAKPFLAELDKLFKSELAKETKEQGKKKLKVSPHPRWGKELDKDNNETGNYFVKCNMKQKYFNKQNELAFEKRPVLFDAALKPIDDLIGGGSKLKVRFEVHPYNTSIGFGLTLHPVAVQVIQLHTPSGSMDAANYGFTAQEEVQVNGGESFPEEVFAVAADDKDDF